MIGNMYRSSMTWTPLRVQMAGIHGNSVIRWGRVDALSHCKSVLQVGNFKYENIYLSITLSMQHCPVAGGCGRQPSMLRKETAKSTVQDDYNRRARSNMHGALSKVTLVKKQDERMIVCVVCSSLSNPIYRVNEHQMTNVYPQWRWLLPDDYRRGQLRRT